MLYQTVQDERLTRARQPHQPTHTDDRKARSRPWRVLALSALAVVATVSAMGGMSELLWNASGDRYAEDVIRTAL